MESLDNERLLRELQERNTLLNHSLAEQQELNNELLEVNRKLHESEALKSHFLSNISNEIVNPFTAITNLARSILKTGENDFGTIRKMTSLILCEALHLDFQLKNIFMAAAIEAGEVSCEYRPADLNKIIGQIVDSYTDDAQKKKIKVNISIENSSDWITDPEKFELIFINLFNNALLFTRENSTIGIGLKNGEKGLHLEVKDQGNGMDSDELNMIFDRFKRLENRINSINRGNGLGLSITKALVDLMDGVIEIESEKGTGSVFRVFLPKHETGIHASNPVSESGNETFFSEEVIF
jgi:signal transduction histidine kinase